MTSKPPASDAAPRRSRRRKAVMGLMCVLAFVGLLEAVLRLAGYPQGIFAATYGAVEGPYRPNQEEVHRSGPIQYRLKANSHGFRGPEFRKPPDKPNPQIVAVGDSVTLGFFVDEDATYPHFLQEILAAQGLDAEVINAGFGDCSIERVHAVVRDFAIPMKADVVVLTFVTNDLSDIAGKSVNELLSQKLVRKESGGWRAWIVNRTAIGEAVWDVYLRLTTRSYRRQEREAEGVERGDSKSKASGELQDPRYSDPQAREYDRNCQIFFQSYMNTDGQLLAKGPVPSDDPPSGVLAEMEKYLVVLQEIKRLCDSQGTKLLFVYCPAYPQIYLPLDAPFPRVFRKRIEALNIPYCDLTDHFRARADSGPYHLAPHDFHFNPKGNRTLAEGIAESLRKEGMLSK